MQNEGTAMPGLRAVGDSNGKAPYKVGVLAKRFGVSPSTLYRAIQAGELTAYRIGKGRGVVRVPADAAEAYEAHVIMAARSAVA